MGTSFEKTIKLSQLPANELLIDDSSAFIRLASVVREGIERQQKEYTERNWYTVAGRYVLDYGPDAPVEIK